MFKLSNQQFLVLFDIAKGCLYSEQQQFAGYSKEEIMRLLNDIVSQQDNDTPMQLEKGNPTKIGNIGKKITKTDNEDFWDD